MAVALHTVSGISGGTVREHEPKKCQKPNRSTRNCALSCKQGSSLSSSWISGDRDFRLQVSFLHRVPPTNRRRPGVRAMDAAIGAGGEDEGVPSVFPRIKVRDPYKRLGLGRDASTEEIQDARSFLIQEFSGQEKSIESIEAAYDSIIAEKFKNRKRTKINLKSDLKKRVEESPGWVRAVLNHFEAPSGSVMAQRFVLFALLGAWSITNPSEGGPAFQVAVALAACVYLLNTRLKSLGRSCLYGFVTLVIGWVVGSLVVPFLPVAILPRFWSLELGTALVAYVFLWITTTFAK